MVFIYISLSVQKEGGLNSKPANMVWFEEVTIRVVILAGMLNSS